MGLMINSQFNSCEKDRDSILDLLQKKTEVNLEQIGFPKEGSGECYLYLPL